MKPFRKSRFPSLSHDSEQTMTVAELKAALDCYPADMPVIATWEGVTRAVVRENFTVEDAYLVEPCLTIDVEF